jgi:hypothetical protein
MYKAEYLCGERQDLCDELVLCFGEDARGMLQI